MALDPNSREARREARRQLHRQRRDRYGLVAPITLIAIGAIFLVAQFFPAWGVGKTWPILLIVIGLAKLVESASEGKSLPPG